jgi:hypothetical protein
MKDHHKFIREEFKEEVNEIVDPIVNKPKSKDELMIDLIGETFIDLHAKYVEPPIYLGIVTGFSGKIERVCTPGNLSAITGKAKAKKSFLQTMFIASAVSNGFIQNKIKSNLPANKRAVLVFDTEQSQYDVFRVGNRVKNLIGFIPENLGLFSLRGMAAPEIIELIEFALEKNPLTGMIFIDQVADLARSINSEEEAVSIVRWLEKLSQEKDLHICCVIHQNKADNFASGWLGSQVMKKAETVISVEKEPKNKDISHVKPSLSRSRDFEEFSMMITDAGMPVILGEDERREYEESEF